MPTRNGARALALLLLLPAALALQWLAAAAPAAVENVYARGVYPVVAWLLATTLGRIPFAVAEPLLLLAVAAVAVASGSWTLRFIRRAETRRRLLGRAARAVVGAAGGLYAAFLLLWGLNYRRQPFAASAGLEIRPVSLAELTQVAATLVEEANRLREGLPEDGEGALRLADGVGGAVRRAGAGYARAVMRYRFLEGVVTPPKRPLLSVVLSYAGISGMFVPFTGEPNVNATLPEADVPFAACHELAHQRGFAREDEANYVGYVACRLHPDADFRYSGVLTASLHAQGAVSAVDRPAFVRLHETRSPAVRRDLAAMQRWAERYRGPLERISERVNDAYLKSQGQREGVRSYGRMVDLLVAEHRLDRRSRP